MSINPSELFSSIAKKKRKSLIGLMSGMSMDGVDLAHVEISGKFPDLAIQLIGTHYRPYDLPFREHLLRARNGSVEDVAELDFEVGEVFSGTVLEYLHGKKLDRASIDAIGSHGQSLFGRMAPAGKTRTIQIGSGSVIAERTGVLTVFNFRIRDIAVGGNAAPLVPLLDFILYRQKHGVVAINNLGSISNTTVVTQELASVVATDLGPANMPIDFFAERMLGAGQIDRDGTLSAQGKVLPEVLADLCSPEFFKRQIPKAASYSEFGPAFLDEVARKHARCAPEDLLRTAVEFSARTTADAYHQFILPKFPELKLIKYSGGGVHNQTLMTRLKSLIPECESENLAQSDREFSDAKEAVAFAVLAHETLCGRPGNVPGATGARKATLLGEIALRSW